jgi:hypothetical protein
MTNEEALKLADWLEDGEVERYDIDEAVVVIRQLVAKLECYEKLTDASKMASKPISEKSRAILRKAQNG